MSTAVKPGRRTRYDAPAWADRFDLSSPEGFDAMAAHGEARKLDLSTDPDTIDDPEVRDAFLTILNEEAEHALADDEPFTSSEGSGSPDSPAGSGNRGRQGRPGASSPPARLGRAVGADAGSWLSRPDVDDASGLLLGLVAYALVVAALRDPVSASNGVKSWFRAKFFNIPASGAQLTLSQQSDAAALGSLLLDPVTTTDATPRQPAPPTDLAGILSQGLPPSAFAAPKPPAPAGVAS